MTDLLSPSALSARALQPGPLALPSPRTAPDSAALLALLDADLDATADRLHDGVLQALVVARYACDAVVRGADPVLARAAVQDALVALRREVWALRPRGTDGLLDALAALCAQRAEVGLPGPDLHLDAALAERLPEPAAALAYRLVQALAGDRALTVRLSAEGDLALLDLDAPLDAPAAWSLRAGAVGAELLTDPGGTRLLLPLPRSDDKDQP